MSDLLSIENAVLPTHYDIRLEIDPTKTNYKGSVQLLLKPNGLNGDSFREFKLHSKDLVILSASIGDVGSSDELKTVLEVTQDNAGELIVFSSPNSISFSTEKGLELKIAYIGRIKTIKTYNDDTEGIFKTNFMDPKTGKANGYVIATHGQPYFARTIFPCIDEPFWKTTFQLSIKTLSRFTVLSNTGKKSSEPITSTTYTLSKFKQTPLMATSVFGFVIGDFQMINTEVSSKYSQEKLPISVYSPSNIQDATFALDTTQKYLPILEQFFDKSYPLDKLDFVLLPFLKDMAMENFGLITVQMNHLLLPPTALADTRTTQQVQQLIVHELVHQWIGNHISFESFEYLWFNESFATWCACHLLEINDDLPGYWTSKEYLIDQTSVAISNDSDSRTPSIAASSMKAVMCSPSKTADLFDSHSYVKGIALLRGMVLATGADHFRDALQMVLKDDSLHTRSVKPIDIIFKMASTLKSENLTNYFSSWCRTAGLPIVEVSLTDKDGKVSTKLVQHRYLVSEDTDYEDVPYQIPLLIQLPDGELDSKHILMTDRTLDIDYPILLCNHDSQGYYHVSYESESIYAQITEHLSSGDLSGTDLQKIFSDLACYIGNPAYQKPIHLTGLHMLLTHLSSDNVDLKRFPQYWDGIRTGLLVLTAIYADSASYGRPVRAALNYVSSIAQNFIGKIDWPVGKFEEMAFSSEQLDCMSKVMFLARDSPKIHELSQNYLNHILHGPPRSIPIEVVESAIAVLSQNAKNTKQWRRLFELAKSCKGIEKNISFTNSNVSDATETLRFYAITNLCFSSNYEIIKGALEFVTSNLTVSGIDSVLTGLSYSACKYSTGVKKDVQVRDIVWEWFETHFDGWGHDSMKKDSSAESVKTAVISITNHVFQMFVDTPERIDNFLVAKKEPYGKSLDIADNWETIKLHKDEVGVTLEGQLNDQL